MLPDTADLAWLIGEEAPPPRRLRSPLERAGAVAFAVSAWQVLPWLAPRIRAATETQDAATAVLADVELLLRLHTQIQESVIRALVARLDAVGIPAVLLKGAAMRHVAWPEPGHRASWDIDIGVAPAHLTEVEAVARALGFHPAIRARGSGRFVPAPRLYRALLESRNHELCAMVREARITDLTEDERGAIERAIPAIGTLLWDRRSGHVIVRSAIDIHHGLDPELPIGPVLATAQRHDGLPVPSQAWAATHAARTLYRHGGAEGPGLLHALADLARLVAASDRAALADELQAATPLAPIPALVATLRAGAPSLPALLRACAPSARVAALLIGSTDI